MAQLWRGVFNITEHECKMRMENGFRYMHRLPEELYDKSIEMKRSIEDENIPEE